MRIYLNIVRHAVRLGLTSMRDPHVMALHYTAVIVESTDYDRAPSLEFEVPNFSLKLDKGHLLCLPKMHFCSAEEARAVIEELLRAWEAHAALHYGKEELLFRFMRADIIDRDPPPPALTNYRIGAVTLTGGGSITCSGHVSRSSILLLLGYLGSPPKRTCSISGMTNTKKVVNHYKPWHMLALPFLKKVRLIDGLQQNNITLMRRFFEKWVKSPQRVVTLSPPESSKKRESNDHCRMWRLSG